MTERNIYKSMQGKEIDINRIMNKNEMVVAVGNAKVNARGDELGPGGKIVRRREDVISSKTPTTPVQQITIPPVEQMPKVTKVTKKAGVKSDE